MNGRDLVADKAQEEVERLSISVDQAHSTHRAKEAERRQACDAPKEKAHVCEASAGLSMDDAQ